MSRAGGRGVKGEPDRPGIHVCTEESCAIRGFFEDVVFHQFVRFEPLQLEAADSSEVERSCVICRIAANPPPPFPPRCAQLPNERASPHPPPPPPIMGGISPCLSRPSPTASPTSGCKLPPPPLFRRPAGRCIQLTGGGGGEGWRKAMEGWRNVGRVGEERWGGGDLHGRREKEKRREERQRD